MVKNLGTKQRGQRILGDLWQWKPTGSVLKETIAVSVTILISVQKMTQPNPSPSFFMQQDERNASKTRSPRGRSPSGRMSRWPCKEYLLGTCTTPFCENGILQNACSTSPKMGTGLGEKCSYAHRRVDEQPSKRSKKNGDKSAEAMLKITRQLGCVFQDMEPPKSSSILRKSSDIRKPIRRVKNSQSRCTSRIHSRQESIAWNDSPK